MKKSKERRVAIVAFIGSDAEAFLPKAKGLELICWPKEGGTNPDALRRLIKNGVNVMFSDSLHMKIYWSQDQGAVITSANLSSNALGSGNLKEFGIRIPAGKLNIDRVVESVNARPIVESELRKLDRLNKEYLMRNPRVLNTQDKKISFKQWFELPYPPEWKLGWCDCDGTACKEARKIAKEDYNSLSINDFIAANEDDFSENDWVLTFRIDNLSKISWLYVDYLAKVPKSEGEKYPYQAVQVRSSRLYPAPPFRANKAFRDAFSKAVNDFGKTKIKNLVSCVPPAKLLNLIKQHSQE